MDEIRIAAGGRTGRAQVEDPLVEQVLPALAPRLRQLVAGLEPAFLKRLEEIRLAVNRPLTLVADEGDRFLDRRGRTCREPLNAVAVTREDVERTLQLASGSSLYALEHELAQGFLTLPGGHRLGLCGQVLIGAGGRPERFRAIAALNLRISREVQGAAWPLLPHLLTSADRPGVHNTLIFGPPRSGKTTVLRDLVRLLSNGAPPRRRGFRVGLVDERSELAGSYRGVPQRDVGVRTDVLDGCPKAVGMMMLLRTMGPQILATDELGRREDAEAVEEALHAGVRIVTTAHGGSLAALRRRPGMGPLVAEGVFTRVVRLGRSRGPGTLESVCDAVGKRVGTPDAGSGGDGG